MGPRKIDFEDAEWINLAYNMDRLQSLLDTVMYLQVTQKTENFFLNFLSVY